MDLAVQGRRVTQARATASVDGREVLTVNAALGTGELTSPTPWLTMPDVPRTRRLSSTPDAQSLRKLHLQLRRDANRARAQLRRTRRDQRVAHLGAVGSRAESHLEPSAATLAIFGDFVAGGAQSTPRPNTMGRSLDNTIRVATLVPTEWVLVETHMHALVGRILSRDRIPLESRRGTARHRQSVDVVQVLGSAEQLAPRAARVTWYALGL